jgi:hypothetical protein
MMMTAVAENNFGDTMSDGLAGPMGLLIIVLLAIATALLIRSMNRHLRRIPERFPSQPATAGPASAPAGPAAVADGSGDSGPERSVGRAASGGTASAASGGTASAASGGTAPAASGGTAPAASGGTAPAAGGSADASADEG